MSRKTGEPKMSLKSGAGSGAIAIALSIVVSLSGCAKNPDEKKNPIIGTWELTSDW